MNKSKLTKIILGEYIELLTDYHSNGSYKKLKQNVELLSEKEYAIMIRTLNFEHKDYIKNLIYVNEHAYNYLLKSKVYKDDIIMNKIANPGSVYRMPQMEQPVTLGMNLFLIRFNNSVNQRYMYYNMLNSEKYIKSKADGTTTKTITKDSVKKLELYIHKRDEQDKIANFLDLINDKIELNNKMVLELEQMVKTIYHYWFIQFEFPNKTGQPYKSSGGEMVWSEKLKKKIPKGWECLSLDKCITIQKGISYKSSQISINSKDIAMINLKCFELGGGYKTDNIKFLHQNINRNKIINEGDLVIACTDLTRNAEIIGCSFLIPNLGYKLYVASCDVAVIKVVNGHISKYFLNTLFNSERYRKYIKGYASGTNVLHLDIDGIKGYKVEIPDKYTLNKFDKLIKDIEIKKSMVITQNEELIKLRELLLPMLMNGQIRFKDVKVLVNESIG